MTETSEYISDSSREFAIYSAEHRGIPGVSDGLKDSQRKALWCIRNKKDKIKVVSLSGEMISSNLYLHGDTSASGAISMLAAPFQNNVTLLDGIGTFGTRVNPTAFGAPRYVYVKKSKFLDTVMFSDLDIIPMKENYDGSVMEPITFLPIIPTVLLNGISGMAYGWSTEILPRSLKTLVEACTAVLEEKPSVALTPEYTYLQTSTKALGPNQWSFEGKVEIVDSSTIRVTELPPGYSLESFRADLDKYEEKDIIKDYVDSSRKQIDVLIKMKRGSVLKGTEEEYIDLFYLRSKFTERIVVLDWDFQSICQYETAEELVKDFVAWRFGKYVERFEKFIVDDQL